MTLDALAPASATAPISANMRTNLLLSLVVPFHSHSLSMILKRQFTMNAEGCQNGQARGRDRTRVARPRPAAGPQQHTHIHRRSLLADAAGSGTPSTPYKRASAIQQKPMTASSVPSRPPRAPPSRTPPPTGSNTPNRTYGSSLTTMPILAVSQSSPPPRARCSQPRSSTSLTPS